MQKGLWIILTHTDRGALVLQHCNLNAETFRNDKKSFII